MSRLPEPNTAGTDPDDPNAVLRERFSMGGTAVPAPPAGSPRPAKPPPRRPARGTRPDPDGMRRISYYVSAEAADAMEAAVEQVAAALGEDVPKHKALSALLLDAASRAPQVATDLATARAEELARRLQELQART